MNPASYQHMTRDARIQRIGEILARGIAIVATRDEANEASSCCSAKPAPEVDERTRSALELIWKFGEISPRELQEHLGASRSTATRAIRDWQREGFIKKSGETSAIRLQLGPLGKRVVRAA
ncbi:MAG: putative HTH transcriptional regulator [Verrucomicrobiales bacterium]|jgi:predicted HTH transcriptional regulator